MSDSDQPPAISGKALTGKGLASHIERTVALARQNGLNKVVLTGTPESWDAVIAALRSAGTEGGETQGAVEMREACARWHDERTDHHECEAQWPGVRSGPAAGHRELARDHKRYAAKIRALPLPGPRTTDGGEA